MRRVGLSVALAALMAIGVVSGADARGPARVDASGAASAVTPAASGYTYRVLANYCYGTNGNSVYFKVKETAKGWTPADGLTINSTAQYRNPGSFTWHTVYVWPRADYGFSDNGQNHWQTLWRGYVGNNSRYFRISMTLRVWEGNSVLATKTLSSISC